MTAREWLQENDIRLFLEKAKVGEARKQFMDASGQKVSAKDFAEARDVCRYWKTARRRRVRESSALTDEEWMRVRRAIRETQTDLVGRTEREAMDLIRTRVSVNIDIMRGVAKSHQVWERGA